MSYARLWWWLTIYFLRLHNYDSMVVVAWPMTFLLYNLKTHTYASRKLGGTNKSHLVCLGSCAPPALKILLPYHAPQMLKNVTLWNLWGRRCLSGGGWDGWQATRGKQKDCVPTHPPPGHTLGISSLASLATYLSLRQNFGLRQSVCIVFSALHQYEVYRERIWITGFRKTLFM